MEGVGAHGAPDGAALNLGGDDDGVEGGAVSQQRADRVDAALKHGNVQGADGEDKQS